MLYTPSVRYAARKPMVHPETTGGTSLQNGRIGARESRQIIAFASARVCALALYLVLRKHFIN
jgi:hypothetical protein